MWSRRRHLPPASRVRRRGPRVLIVKYGPEVREEEWVLACGGPSRLSLVFSGCSEGREFWGDGTRATAPCRDVAAKPTGARAQVWCWLGASPRTPRSRGRGAAPEEVNERLDGGSHTERIVTFKSALRLCGFCFLNLPDTLQIETRTCAFYLILREVTSLTSG